jgi:malonyl CoA-acyl carrier protein transacylase
MSEFNVTGVNQALSQALLSLQDRHQVRDSRNGPVVAFHEPVMTTYRNPMERVVFSPMRDANPFFHLTEAMWMLAGKRTLAELTPIVKRMADFSDDGSTLYGAYGYRWRRAFGTDQLADIATEIKKDPTTRRAVLSMWDPRGDHQKAFSGGKDVPCNTHVYFDARDGKLNMTVCCRSNDLLWGCYGANVVHFGFLLEYMAAATNLPIGVYRQFSNDLHVYTDKLALADFGTLAADVAKHDWYRDGIGYQCLLDDGETVEEVDEDINAFFDAKSDFDVQEYNTSFFNFTMVPAMLAWRGWKYRAVSETAVLEHAKRIQAPDWRLACTEWLDRRAAK